MNLQSLSSRRSLVRLSALLALSACDPDIDLAPGDTLHPTPANAPPADAAIITTDSEPQGLSAEALDQWRAARDVLLGAHVTLALGTNEDEGPELFGGILDAAFDRDGNVLVLDAISYEVRTFDRDGRHRGSFGQQGEGPMDFDGTLQSLEVLEDGRLVVGIRGIGMKVLPPLRERTSIRIWFPCCR